MGTTGDNSSLKTFFSIFTCKKLDNFAGYNWHHFKKSLNTLKPLISFRYTCIERSTSSMSKYHPSTYHMHIHKGIHIKIQKIHGVTSKKYVHSDFIKFSGENFKT